MKHLREQLIDLETKDLNVGTSRGSLAIQQTQRNAEKSNLINAFLKDLQDMAEDYGFDVFLTPDGPVLTLMNDSVYASTGDLRRQAEKLASQGVQTSLGSIAIEFDIKIKNLDYDAAYEAEMYAEDLEQARIEKAEAQKAKERKIAKDAEARAEKEQLKQQLINERLKKAASE